MLYSVLVVRGGEWRVMVKVMDRLYRVGFQVCGVTMQEESRTEEESPRSGENTSKSARDTVVCIVCLFDRNSVCGLITCAHTNCMCLI